MPPAPVSDTRNALLEAALLCFAKYGREAASIRLVASMAGRNSSLIAYHFGSKEGLHREVVRYVLTHLTAPFPPEGFPLGSGHDRLRAYICWLLSDLARVHQSRDPRWVAARRILLSELHFPHPETRDLLAEHLDAPTRELRAILREIRPDLDGSEVAFWGFIVQGCCLVPLFADFGSLIWPEFSEPALRFPSQPEELAGRLTALIHTGLTRPETAPCIPHHPPQEHP